MASLGEQSPHFADGAGDGGAIHPEPAGQHVVHAYLRWRNKNARHPDVLAAQRRERARIRSEVFSAT
ncbi:hypothetical protein [Streptomyces sp. CNQ085]|uniref:hypothetical protein n=1 Tax=Streptomyces sp. CNQ085 TaxID=2886944 RepID=UPI001F511EC7|nr:hypothetical protein [Streptomyces sp. CNQ085]MCI0386300.1 hypothetical protein [Streptomyces sp. CNQ085]